MTISYIKEKYSYDDNYDDVDDDDDNKEEEHVTLQDFELLLAPQLTSSRRRIYAKR